MFKDLRSVSST